MATTARTVMMAMGLVVVGLAATTPETFGEEPEGSAIRILVINKMGLPPRDTLVEAQAEAARIYAAVGVRIAWTESLSTLPRLTMMIVSNPNAWPERVGADALGAAPAADQGTGHLAYAFHDRIRASAQRHVTDPAKVLGHVMAHELGHLLLARASHSSTGIMSDRWGQFEMDLIAANLMKFTNEQARLIRRTVAGMNADLKRSRHDRPPR
jgi:hypothetical protein